jgi:hypothetical protein
VEVALNPALLGCCCWADVVGAGLAAAVVGVAAACLAVLATLPAPAGLPLGLLVGVLCGGAGLAVAVLWAAWLVVAGCCCSVSAAGVVAAVVSAAAAAAAAALLAFVGLPLGFCGPPVWDLWLSMAGPAAILGAAAFWLAVWLGLGGLAPVSSAAVVAGVVSVIVGCGLAFFLGLPLPLDGWLGLGVPCGPWLGWLAPGWLLVKVTLATAVAGCHSPLEFIRLLGSACFRITPSVISLDNGSLCLE